MNCKRAERSSHLVMRQLICYFNRLRELAICASEIINRKLLLSIKRRMPSMAPVERKSFSQSGMFVIKTGGTWFMKHSSSSPHKWLWDVNNLWLLRSGCYEKRPRMRESLHRVLHNGMTRLNLIIRCLWPRTESPIKVYRDMRIDDGLFWRCLFFPNNRRRSFVFSSRLFFLLRCQFAMH